MFVDTVMINETQTFKNDTEVIIAFWQYAFFEAMDIKHATVMKELLELLQLQVFTVDGNWMDLQWVRGWRSLHREASDPGDSNF